DRGTTRFGSNTWGGNLIINAPPHIFGPRLAAVAPPGVALFGGIRMQAAIHIYPGQLAQHFSHPGALFWQKTAVFQIAFPVLQVGFVVRNIPVTTNNELAASIAVFLHQAINPLLKMIQKAVLGGLTLVA